MSPEPMAGARMGVGVLRVAIVGAGPSGFFAAGELLKVRDAKVDMLDRLPAPFGLVRHGVAPDHPGIKSVIGRYDQAASKGGPRFRLLGNVEVGRDVSLQDLRGRYHAVILAYGAAESRRLGIPGEDLPGVHPASDFVGWYNGQPEKAGLSFDLAFERAVVIGVGNVALDVARLLLKPLSDLARTDISDRALSAMEHRQVREVVLLGRHGSARAAFTPPELAELGGIDGVDLVISREDRQLDPDSADRIARGTLDALTERKLAAVAKAREEVREGRRAARVRFWTSPVEILGQSRVEAIRVCRNAMLPGPDGALRLTATEHTDVIPCGLVFLSIGYRVQPLAGVPFDEVRGAIPHLRGRVVAGGAGAVPGLYVTGWAKRGPRGVIGSNKPDAQETVQSLLEDLGAGLLPPPSTSEDLEETLADRGAQLVSYPDWKLLDALEIDAGRPAGRPRRKFTDTESMLEALATVRPEPERDGTGG